MKLTVFNGSSKPGINNTETLVEKLAAGFIASGQNQYVTYQLNQFKDLNEAVNIYKDSECVIIAFPLNNFSMTAIVKEFIEKLEPISQERTGKKIGFLVQFGFSEAIHARPLERYLEKLAGLLKGEYLGTIIKGGCNDLSSKPEKYKRTFADIYEIGKQFGKTGHLDREALIRFSRPERLSPLIPKIFLRLAVIFINKFYVDAILKKNGAR